MFVWRFFYNFVYEEVANKMSWTSKTTTTNNRRRRRWKIRLKRHAVHLKSFKYNQISKIYD